MLKISEKTKQLIEYANLVFICIFFIYTIFREVIPTDIFVGSSVLSYLAFAGCFVLASVNFVTDKDFLKTPNLIAFSAFIGVSGISVLINRQFAFSSNINGMLWMIVLLFFIFPLGRNYVFNNPKNKKIVLSVIAVTLYLLTAISVVMYYFDIDYTFHKTSGILTNQGFSNKYIRLWGVFQEANYGAICAIIGLIIVIYFFLQTKKIYTKIFLATAGITFLSYVVLSGSRTALLVSILGCIWGAFYGVFSRTDKAVFRKLLFSAVSCVLAVSLFLGAFYGLKAVLPYTKAAVLNVTTEKTYAAIHKAYDSIYRLGKVNILEGFYEPEDAMTSTGGDPDSSDGNSRPNKVVKLERPDLSDDEDISNGRLTRWKDGFSIFSSSPLFGASPRGISEFAKLHNPDTTMAKYNYSISNTYLEILAGTGIVGFLVLLIIIARTVFVVFIKRLTSKAAMEQILFSLIILIPALAAVLQTDLFFNLTFSGTVFWLITGYLYKGEKGCKFLSEGKKQ